MSNEAPHSGGTRQAVEVLSPLALRQKIRAGKFRGTTSGAAPGYAQANLVVLSTDWAEDFRLFCELNPGPCPLLDVTSPGSPHPQRLAPFADIRTDIPGYRLFDSDSWHQVDSLMSAWSSDSVAFLLGCSFSFEPALIASGIVMRHIEIGVTVPMFITSMRCNQAGRIGGRLVVSMRPIKEDLVELAFRVARQYPGSHGAPLHVGNPREIGISDLNRPDFGDPVPFRSGEVPVFWACGVTAQIALEQSNCPWFAVHKPGHMFVSDLGAKIPVIGQGD